jgi:hypothetical protein
MALALMLGLSSPGVRVVRAADDAAAAAGDGAVCEAGTVRDANEVAGYLQDVQQLHDEQVAEQLTAPRSDDDTIVLNNRGYNYGKPNFAFPRASELGR